MAKNFRIAVQTTPSGVFNRGLFVQMDLQGGCVTLKRWPETVAVWFASRRGRVLPLRLMPRRSGACDSRWPRARPALRSLLWLVFSLGCVRCAQAGFVLLLPPCVAGKLAHSRAFAAVLVRALVMVHFVLSPQVQSTLCAGLPPAAGAVVRRTCISFTPSCTAHLPFAFSRPHRGRMPVCAGLSPESAKWVSGAVFAHLSHRLASGCANSPSELAGRISGGVFAHPPALRRACSCRFPI